MSQRPSKPIHFGSCSALPLTAIRGVWHFLSLSRSVLAFFILYLGSRSLGKKPNPFWRFCFRVSVFCLFVCSFVRVNRRLWRGIVQIGRARQQDCRGRHCECLMGCRFRVLSAAGSSAAASSSSGCKWNRCTVYPNTSFLSEARLAKALVLRLR